MPLSPSPSTQTKWRGISTLLGGRGARRQFIPSADPLPRMRSTGESDDHSFEVARAASAGNAARATTTGDPTLKHEKSLIQMDWSFIMASAAADSSGRAAVAAAGGGADGGNKGAEAGSPQSVEVRGESSGVFTTWSNTMVEVKTT